MNIKKEITKIAPHPRVREFCPSDGNSSAMTLKEFAEIIEAAIMQYNNEPLPSPIPSERLESKDTMKGIELRGCGVQVSSLGEITVQKMRSKP